MHGSQQTVELWNIIQVMRIPYHLTCLLRNLYAGQEATELDMEQWTVSKLGKKVCQGCILSPRLFNLYAENIMWNVGLDESQAAIQIAKRHINNLRYADDTAVMAESQEELKHLLMKVKKRVKKLA